MTPDELNAQTDQKERDETFARERVGGIAAGIFSRLVAANPESNTAKIVAFVDKSIDSSLHFCRAMFGIEGHRQQPSRPITTHAVSDGNKEQPPIESSE